MNFKAPSYLAVAVVSYTTFSVFGFATWYTLLFASLPSGATAMSTLHTLLALEPSAPPLRFHAISTLVTAAFAVFLWLKPLKTSNARLLAVGAATLFAVIAWAVYQSDTALLPTVAAGALAMGHIKGSARDEQ